MDAMLQRLLAERFKLTVRRDTKGAPIYALTATKSGPSLKPSDASTVIERVERPGEN